MDAVSWEVVGRIRTATCTDVVEPDEVDDDEGAIGSEMVFEAGKATISSPLGVSGTRRLPSQAKFFYCSHGWQGCQTERQHHVTQ